MSLESIKVQLKNLGLELPEVPKPLAAYIPAKRGGNLIFVSGQLPLKNEELLGEGSVPNEVLPEHAKDCAKQCFLNGVAAALSLLNAGEELELLQVQGFVQSELTFHNQPAIVDGASELAIAIFGESGKHSRAAVGVKSLPKNAPVEIALVFAVK
ncbi:hypothetical protein AGMMS49938_18590 [Fibrobacterales bacterium]|nr:hypothetical protein AGMMS49938_18590 [Fibrobacterales bacterium]